VCFLIETSELNFSGKCPQRQENIATTKLIQCGNAEKPENKAFRGFCGFIFLLFEPFFCGGSSFVFLILHHFLTIAGIVKRYEWGDG